MLGYPSRMAQPGPKQNPIAFVLAASAAGPMIVNRLDYSPKDDGEELGVGLGLLNSGHHGIEVTGLVCELAEFRREQNGPGVVILDGGANIGTFTVAWAKHMTPEDGHSWGTVIAFEPQQWPFYALAGNLALNNCFNAAASWSALGSRKGQIRVPAHDPRVPFNSGSVSLLRYDTHKHTPVPLVSIDDLSMARLDIIKLDIEGMEPSALAGAKDTIARLKPIVVVEWVLCGKEAIAACLPNYQFFELGMDLLAIHESDPAAQRVKLLHSAAGAA